MTSLDRLMPEDVASYDWKRSDYDADRADALNDDAFLEVPHTKVPVTNELIEALQRATSRREITGSHHIELLALQVQLQCARRNAQRRTA
ncbi:MAG: hypothetical protein RLZZ200_515 [Pseudomonadota bacterium]|jgi:hypothetical protein